MTMSVQTPYNSSTGNGVTTVYPYTFRVLSSDDLKVTVDGVLKTIGTHYTVSGVGSGSGGNVTFLTAPANGAKVIRYSDTLMKRDTDYQANGDFRESTVDADFDRLWGGVRDVKAQFDRALRAPNGEALAELPAPATRANALLGFDGTGAPQMVEFADIDAMAVSAYIATLLDDADAATARQTLGIDATAFPGVDYDIDLTGVVSATSAIQSAIDDPTTRVVVLPAGTILIGAPGLVLRDNIVIRGQGRGATTLLKANFSGACISGIDTDSVGVEDLAILGPGDGVGSGNKGIDIHVSSQEICKSVVLRNLDISEVNDVGVYLGSCSFVTWQSVRVHDYGYCGIWIDGGDGHHLSACSTQLGLIGFYINKPSGFGPTTVAMEACYAEQAGRGIWFNGAVSCTASGCGVEAAINYDSTHNGTNWTISGGDGITLLGCLSRNDTIGAVIAAPHVLVDNSAARVTIDGFRKENHASFAAPTWELDCQNASTVVLGRHNFTAGTVRSAGKIITLYPVYFGTSAITSNTRHTFAHGLGIKPTSIRVTIQCTTDDNGYVVGDELDITNNASGTTQMVNTYADNTNIYVVVKNGISAVNPTSVGSAIAGLTMASWTMRVRAFY